MNRTRRVLVAGLAALVVAVASCDPPAATAPTAQLAQPTIYGTDDRTDVYAETDPRLRALAQASAVALFPSSALDTTDPSNVRVTASTLGMAQNLCADQRFLSDPSAALCSGVLIDDDLVLTAGHCLINATECTGGISLVFNYLRTDAATLATITHDDVYRCAGLVAHVSSRTTSSYIDYAIIRLDRPATPRYAPVQVHRGTDPVALGQPVTCIGFPNGIPAKIDSGGTVRDPRAAQGDYFLATTDTFEGSSGSGVFDTATLELRGILLDGDMDYMARGSCNVVYQCSETGCSGESIGYVNHAIDAVCAVGGSPHLCCPDGGPCDAGVGSDAGAEAGIRDAADGALDEGPATHAPGCGCRANGARTPGATGALASLLLAGGFVRRRRARAAGRTPTGRIAAARVRREHA